MLMKRTDQLQDMDPDIPASQATLVTGPVLATLATLDMDLVIPVTFIQHLALATQAIFIQAMDLVILDTQATLDMDQDILDIQATLDMDLAIPDTQVIRDMDQVTLGTQPTLDMDLAILDIQATLDMDLVTLATLAILGMDLVTLAPL